MKFFQADLFGKVETTAGLSPSFVEAWNEVTEPRALFSSGYTGICPVVENKICYKLCRVLHRQKLSATMLSDHLCQMNWKLSASKYDELGVC